MAKKIQIVVRFEPYELKCFDNYVKRSGLSREEYIRTLCGLVTKLNVRPGDTEKLKNAYSKKGIYEE